MLVPEYILSDFEKYGAENYPTGWVIELREKEGRIPLELKIRKESSLTATVINGDAQATASCASLFT